MKRITIIGMIGMLAMTSLSCVGIKDLLSEKPDNTIYLASVGPQADIKDLGFQEGMDLALEEINQKGLLNGKYHMVIDPLDDKDDLTTGMKIAQEIVAESRYTAVIGHWSASVALPTARIYEKGSSLVLSPAVSNVKLTQEAGNSIFRTVPSDQDEINKMVAYMLDKGYDRLAVCYADTEYGRGLVPLLVAVCQDKNITVTDIHEEFISQSEFERQYKKWVALDTNAVFIADSLPSGSATAGQIRGQSASLPILSAGGFSFDDISKLLGEQAENITYIDPYYHEQKQAKIQQFDQLYRQKYSREPGLMSIDGYDIVHRLAAAVEEAGSKDPAVLAQVLKSSDDWEGVAGSSHFDSQGNIVGRNLTIVEVHNGQYRYIN